LFSLSQSTYEREQRASRRINSDSYQAAKNVEFDSSSNDGSFFGPVTRRQWSQLAEPDVNDNQDEVSEIVFLISESGVSLCSAKLYTVSCKFLCRVWCFWGVLDDRKHTSANLGIC
jgi:hypothetical protein